MYDRNTLMLDHDVVAVTIFLFWRLLVSLWPLLLSIRDRVIVESCRWFVLWLFFLVSASILCSWGGICVSCTTKILFEIQQRTSSGQHDWKWLCTRRSQHLPYGRGVNNFNLLLIDLGIVLATHMNCWWSSYAKFSKYIVEIF